jgi:hypothetical protein
MDPLKDLKLLIGQFSTLTKPQKVYVGAQTLIGLFIVIFLIILVFFPETYSLNAAGIWMSRIALGGIILSMAMKEFGADTVRSIEYKKASI